MSEPQQFVIGCVIGTRPEVIKMAPIIFKLQACSWAKVCVINTAQHRHLLDDMLTLFSINPDVDLNSMMANQSLGDLTGNLCIKMEALIKQNHFDVLLAVGDTTTVFITGLIAFYHRIPFGHIEAGLRTYNVKEPFPEEINRVLAAPLATWHFAPTLTEKENLLRENIAENKIVVTGNPVIDALYWVLDNKANQGKYAHLQNTVVVTTHRRENFGNNMRNICLAILELRQRFLDINFLLPVHPNPNVQKEIYSMLQDQPGIYLLPPLRYDEFAHLMAQSLLVITDSGGIQEEAPALHKPVVVLRNTTERPEIIKVGVGVLAGTEQENIVQIVTQLLSDKERYNRMAQSPSPYGDGHAAQRIIDCLYTELLNRHWSIDL